MDYQKTNDFISNVCDALSGVYLLKISLFRHLSESKGD